MPESFHIEDQCLDIDFKNLTKNVDFYSYDTCDIAWCAGSSYERFVHGFRKRRDKIICRPVKTHSDINVMRGLICKWASHMYLNNRKDGTDRMMYYFILTNLIKENPEKFYGLIFYKDTTPIGFTMWQPLSMSRATSLANLTLPGIKNLPKFQFIETCNHLYKDGILNFAVDKLETEGITLKSA